VKGNKMDELQKILDASDASAETKQAALKLAFEVATPIAFNTSASSAGGQFLALLMELLKLLLPILLKLLVV